MSLEENSQKDSENGNLPEANESREPAAGATGSCSGIGCLSVGLALTIGAAGVGGYFLKEYLDAKSDVKAAEAETRHDIDALLKGERQEYETVDMSAVIPECQRTAEDILIHVPYAYSRANNRYRENWNEVFNEFYGSLVNALPSYSKIHLATQKDWIGMSETRRSYYPSFNLFDIGFAQDIGEATGASGEKGQFQILSPRDEMDELRGDYSKMTDPPPNSRDFHFFLLDNLLAKQYPDKFQTKYLDAVFSGGNTSFGVMPDGRKCVFIAASDIVKYMHGVMGIDHKKPLEMNLYQEAKNRYKKAFGTDNLVVIDEEKFLELSTHDELYHASMFGAPFFHNDMIFNQHIVEGKPVMFVSNLKLGADITGSYLPGLPQESLHQLERIGLQFEKMGYKVVDIPVIVPDQNFVNVISFTNKETHKPTVILPYFHIPETVEDYDEQEENPLPSSNAAYNSYLSRAYNDSLRAYEKNGVTVVSVPFSQKNDKNLETHVKNSKIVTTNAGGFHCMVQVLM